MVTRKEVKTVLDRLGITNRFSLRTVDFTDLARCSAQFVTIKDWTPGPKASEVTAELKKIGVCGVSFDAAKGARPICAVVPAQSRQGPEITGFEHLPAVPVEDEQEAK